MALPTPQTAWTLFMSDPVDFVLMFAAVIVVVAVFIWWLRGFIGKERIAALEERLRLAADEQKPLTRQIETLTAQVSSLTTQIEQSAPLPQLAMATAGVTGTIGKLSEANTTLGSTLTMTGVPAGPSGYWLDRRAKELEEQKNSTIPRST
jgi:hypothetical protein